MDKRHLGLTGFGFTLIELLVVIAVIAILSAVVLLVINPAELLRASRDARRISDLATVHQAVNLLKTDAPETQIGSSSVVYISLADSSPTCANLSLPPLAVGWVYNCVSSSTLRKGNGTGWIPVDFSSFSAGTLLPVPPIDPSNSALNNCSANKYENYFYAYATNGNEWEINANLESKKYKEKAELDGGDAPAFESGSNVTLIPPASAAYYTFEDGNTDPSVQTIADASGNLNGGNRGTTGGIEASDPSWSSFAKVGSGSLEFNGINHGATVFDACSLTPRGGELTIEAWIYTRGADIGFQQIVAKNEGSNWNYYFARKVNTQLWFGFFSGGNFSEHNTPAGSLATSTWHHVAAVYSDSGNYVRLYIDGVELVDAPESDSLSLSSTTLRIGKQSGGHFFNGYIDEVVIYHRALTAGEVFLRYKKGL